MFGEYFVQRQSPEVSVDGRQISFGKMAMIVFGDSRENRLHDVPADGGTGTKAIIKIKYDCTVHRRCPYLFSTLIIC